MKEMIAWPPKEYILIERYNDVQVYYLIVSLTGSANGKDILVGNMMSPLSGGWVTSILGKSNFLEPKVALLTSRMMESGVWSKWRKLHEWQLSIDVFKQLNAFLRSKKSNAAIIGNYGQWHL